MGYFGDTICRSASEPNEKSDFAGNRGGQRESPDIRPLRRHSSLRDAFQPHSLRNPCAIREMALWTRRSPPGIPPSEIIQKFSAKESLFKAARDRLRVYIEP